jgi:hypothetical protein
MKTFLLGLLCLVVDAQFIDEDDEYTINCEQSDDNFYTLPLQAMKEGSGQSIKSLDIATVRARTNMTSNHIFAITHEKKTNTNMSTYQLLGCVQSSLYCATNKYEFLCTESG